MMKPTGSPAGAVSSCRSRGCSRHTPRNDWLGGGNRMPGGGRPSRPHEARSCAAGSTPSVLSAMLRCRPPKAGCCSASRSPAPSAIWSGCAWVPAAHRPCERGKVLYFRRRDRVLQQPGIGDDHLAARVVMRNAACPSQSTSTLPPAPGPAAPRMRGRKRRLQQTAQLHGSSPKM